MIQGMWSAERGGVLGLNGVVLSDYAFAKFMIRGVQIIELSIHVSLFQTPLVHCSYL
jgi:hypothetical protein